MCDIRIANINDVAKYVGLSLLVKGYNVSPLKLQKMLYYAQAWHMVFFWQGQHLVSGCSSSMGEWPRLSCDLQCVQG